ncbi:MAG: SPOR domain-containing protein [Sulfitobacter sp.]
MADFNSSSYGTGYESDSLYVETAEPRANRLGTLTNLAGAAVSLVLVAGVGIWGYKLLVRDVSGIPIVRAVQGEMRARPSNPGGELAKHQGLAVNTIAAEGVAAAPADALRLAPKPVDLTEEDQPSATMAVAAMPQGGAEMSAENESDAEGESFDVAAAMEAGDVTNLVAQLTNGVAPLQEMEAKTISAVASADDLGSAANAVLSGPGMNLSKRPQNRPAMADRVIQASASPQPTRTVAAAPVDPTSLPAGTRLAQLGAFDSPEVAQTQWEKLNQRFGPYLEGKSHVIQKATSGGRVFYRLRAMGFDDIADARRFCSALVAENTDCIPVVTR